MNDLSEQPEKRGRSISNELNRELMELHFALPSMLDAQLEEKEGAVDISSEDAALAMQKSFWVLLRYVQHLAFEVDRIRFKLDLDKEPGPFGPPDDEA